MPLGANHPVAQQVKNIIASSGRAVLNALYPNDFEYYICSLELVDSRGKTVDFFVFPVMPSQLTQQEAKIVNIRKTAGGITTLNTTTFEPIDISLNGNFGRRLRLLVGGKSEDFAALQYSVKSGAYTRESIKAGPVNVKVPFLNATIKSGYGCIKILQAIYRKANAVDQYGNPFRLYWYNPALGDNFLVKPISLNLSQNKQENMIWQYQLQMKAISPLDGIKTNDEKSISKTVTASLLTSAANAVAGNIKDSVLKKVTPR